ncbi:Glutamate receptor 2.7 [Acorus gramineus]|uniref:Glutamate receptor n=1 Tax=Acorus gramineus TaxID=55184 RepID=A0AAV9AI27_ACOGR|nr:Glutamate receptor 2.7 [Acorus gramineus]
MSKVTIYMAIDDLYAKQTNFSTNVVLHIKDAKEDVVGAALSAVELWKTDRVMAIIGPQQSAQAKFVSELGNKTQVPIISFTASSPSLTSMSNPYFIRTTVNDSAQVKAIADFVQNFQWREVILVHEDTEYGTGILPDLIDAFRDVSVVVSHRSVIALSATDDVIRDQINRLKATWTRVFVVHMSPSLATRLFRKANEADLMGEESVWITTDGLTNILDTMHPSEIDLMQGVVGLRPYVRKTRKNVEFLRRWKKRFHEDYPDIDASEPTVYDLWAYDSLQALSMAVEQLGRVNFDYGIPGNENDELGISLSGPKLLNYLLNTNFDGLSGKFSLVDGHLISSTFEIINVVGSGKRRIGFWTPEFGVSRSTTSKTDIKSVFWPGEMNDVPRGWEVSTSGKKLRVGVPVKNTFKEFVDVKLNSSTNKISGVGGFSVQVFEAVMKALDYSVPYEYIFLEEQRMWTYDDLIRQVYLKNYDALVGDFTILANRTAYIDFTDPYTEPGISMLVAVTEQHQKGALTFLKPLTSGMWLTSLAFFVYTGFVVWVLENRINHEFGGTPSHQIGTMFYFSFSTLVFAHREALMSNLSKIVVIVWVFVVLVLTTSYTASLSSMLTIQQLQPTVSDVTQLVKNRDYVGYQSGSYVVRLLKQMNFDESRLISFDSDEGYAEAISNGKITAMVDENAYLKVFLHQYCSDKYYSMIGPIANSEGFGFVFSKGSPLVADVSQAIKKLKEEGKLEQIQSQFFVNTTTCQDKVGAPPSSRLSLDSFWGLFFVTGVTSTSALVISFAIFLYHKKHEWRHLVTKSYIFQAFHDEYKEDEKEVKKSLNMVFLGKEEENNEREQNKSKGMNPEEAKK